MRGVDNFRVVGINGEVPVVAFEQTVLGPRQAVVHADPLIPGVGGLEDAAVARTGVHHVLVLGMDGERKDHRTLKTGADLLPRAAVARSEHARAVRPGVDERGTLRSDGDDVKRQQTFVLFAPADSRIGAAQNAGVARGEKQRGVRIKPQDLRNVAAGRPSLPENKQRRKEERQKNAEPRKPAKP